MALHLIIDGYNLLGARGQVGRAPGRDAESGRERLVRELAAYRQRKPHPITVVFDGWQEGLGAEHREHRSGIEVVYSRRGERADQVIQRLAAEFGRDCAVVSSDREVQQGARRRGAAVLDAEAFLTRLTARPVAADPTGRPASATGAAEAPQDPDEDAGGGRPGARARGRARWLEGL